MKDQHSSNGAQELLSPLTPDKKGDYGDWRVLKDLKRIYHKISKVEVSWIPSKHVIKMIRDLMTQKCSIFKTVGYVCTLNTGEHSAQRLMAHKCRFNI